MSANEQMQTSSIRVEFLWHGSVIGEALFDERMLDDGPIAVVDVPAAKPTAADIARALVVRAENGLELTLDVIRIQAKQTRQSSVTGYLVLRRRTPGT